MLVEVFLNITVLIIRIWLGEEDNIRCGFFSDDVGFLIHDDLDGWVTLRGYPVIRSGTLIRTPPTPFSKRTSLPEPQTGRTVVIGFVGW